MNEVENVVENVEENVEESEEEYKAQIEAERKALAGAQRQRRPDPSSRCHRSTRACVCGR